MIYPLRKHLSGLLVLFLFALALHGRSQSDSSLLHIQNLIKKGEWFARAGDRDNSEMLTRRALKRSLSLSNKEQSRALLAMANHHYLFMEYDSAQVYAQRALRISESEKLEWEIAEANRLLGLVHFRNLDYPLALEHCGTAHQKAKSIKDKKLEGACLFCLGGVLRTYYNSSEFDEASSYFEKAKNIAAEVQDTATWVYSLIVLIDMYRYSPEGSAEFGKIEHYLSKAQSLLSTYPHKYLEVVLRIMRGKLFQAEGKDEAALDNYAKALSLSKKMGLKPVIQHILIQRYEFYMEKEDYQNAKASLDEAVEANPMNNEIFGNGFYAELYKKMDQYEKASEYLELKIRIMDTIRRSEQITLVSEWETKYKTKEKEMLLSQQEQELSAKNRQTRLLLFIAFLLLFITGLIVLGFLSQVRAKKKLVRQKKIIEGQAAELQQLDQLKSRFFANVSHELRTPLTLILGPLGTILKRNTASSSDYPLLRLMQQNGQSLLKLINEILDLSKLESSTLILKEEAVELYSFLHHLVSQFESHAQQEGVQLIFQFEADKHLQALLDKAKFEKVVNNLLSNAIKFTPNGGQVQCVMQDQGQSLLFRVTDTGKGIHPNDLPYVFDRFYQSKQPDTPIQGGTGIGLALCREFAQLFKGEIWVESEWKKGSNFFFKFPKKEVMGVPEPFQLLEQSTAVNSKLETIAPPGSLKGAPTILLVEDNSSLRQYIQLVLQDQFNLILAENGEVALERLNGGGQTVDLILSDVMMPVMDGFQLLECLKGNDQFRHIPVIMLTARAALGDKLKALRIGVDDYMLKPFQTEELIARVSNLLKNSKARLLLHQAVVVEEEEEFDEPVLSKADLEWLEKLEELVKEQIDDTQFNLSRLSGQLFISERQLHRRIKNLTGLTPNKYIREIKLQKARTLLEERACSTVSEVSYAVGFNKSDYFSKVFQERFGKLPSSYLS